MPRLAARDLSRRCLSSGKRTVNAAMSNLLQKCFGRDELQPGKGQLSAAQIAHIAADDEVSPARHPKSRAKNVSCLRFFILDYLAFSIQKIA